MVVLSSNFMKINNLNSSLFDRKSSIQLHDVFLKTRVTSLPVSFTNSLLRESLLYFTCMKRECRAVKTTSSVAVFS